jgi:hypothetical protein
MQNALTLLCAWAFTLLTTLHTNGQRPDFSDDVYYNSTFTFETGFSFGGMNCLTDLGGKKGIGKSFIGDVNFKNTELCGSIFFAEHYKNVVSFRTEFTWGVVKASDNVLSSVKETTLGRYERNLNFYSTVFEIMAAVEIHPLYISQKYGPNQKLHRFSPYLMGGLGFFVYNPRTQLNGAWINLQPLRTEGQGFTEYPDRKPYKLKQFNFPIGGGVRFKLIPNINISAECVYRILNTDYLDDVSTNYVERKLFRKYLDPTIVGNAEALYDRQREINPNHVTNVGDIRGNPKKNDSYFSLSFKVGILF